MKLSKALDLGLWFNVKIAFFPTLKTILCNPLLIFAPRKISQIYMSKLWVLYGDGIDGNSKQIKEALITPYAYGTVLDIGAGHGHTVRYLDRARVSRYIALEPNNLMHPYIRAEADKAGFSEADGTFIILSCGAEETLSILTTLALADTSSKSTANGNSQPADTIVSILTLCSVPNPEKTATDLVRDILKPGGYFLMNEHSLSKRADVAWWQKFWSPIWSIGFDGCKLDRPTDVTINNLKIEAADGNFESAWREAKMWNEEGDEEHLFYQTQGIFVKI